MLESIKKTLLGFLGFGDQMFQSDETKRENVERAALAVKELFGDTGVVQQSDDDVVVRGAYKGVPASVEIGVTFGKHKVAVETLCDQPRSHMTLAHDADGKQPTIAGATEVPDSFGHVKRFVTNTIYVEDKPKAVDAFLALLSKLPSELTQQLYGQLEARGGVCSFGANKIQLSPWKSNVASKGGPDLIRSDLDLAIALATATQDGWR